jgi:diguanylate cyclase (GGDEF)-like protein/PAS domain S-box-containing protein
LNRSTLHAPERQCGAATEVERAMSQISMSALRDLQRLILRLNVGTDLQTTLQEVVDGVVEGLGFDVAVVNLVHDPEFVQVVAVAGSEEATAALLGEVGTEADWLGALKVAEEWGALRFVDHEHFVVGMSELPTWVPDLQVSDEPDAWHPLDALFAPLHSPAGELIGVLSVDLPANRRKPNELQRELLEMYAVQAAIAIDNARLTEALRAEERQLAASERAFRAAFESAPVGMSLLDLRDRPGRYLRVNDAMCRILGYTAEQLLDTAYADITHPDDRREDDAAMARALAGTQDIHRVEKRYLRADGEWVWVSLNTSVVRDSEGRALYGITQFEDISARHHAHLELTRRARLDPLTGLPNRTSLHERVEQSLITAAKSGRPGAVLFCDLDRFKPVNDTHGHKIGDRVLGVVARRLETQVRSGDTAARFGGDEFVIVADGISGVELDHLVERLQVAVARPIDIDGIAVSISMTVGRIAVPTDGGTTSDGLIDRADAAMYRLKR